MFGALDGGRLSVGVNYCGGLRRGFRRWRSGAGAEEAFEEIATKVLRFFLGCDFPGHGGVGSEKQLRDIGESDGVAAGDAFASKLSDEIAEEEIHLVGGSEAVNVAKKLRGEDLGVDDGNSRFEAVCMVGAERRAAGAMLGAKILGDQHVAALAAGVLELALGIGELFWGHRVAFRKIEVTT
jgi:hypothetical protein